MSKYDREHYIDLCYGVLRPYFDNEAELRAMLEKHGVAWPRCSNHIGSGWIPHVDKLICNLIGMGWDKECHQIKEKFGSLRFYVGHATDEQRNMIRDFEDMTIHMCEVCGEEAKIADWGKNGNIRCLCDSHGEMWFNIKNREDNA